MCAFNSFFSFHFYFHNVLFGTLWRYLCSTMIPWLICARCFCFFSFFYLYFLSLLVRVVVGHVGEEGTKQLSQTLLVCILGPGARRGNHPHFDVFYFYFSYLFVGRRASRHGRGTKPKDKKKETGKRRPRWHSCRRKSPSRWQKAEKKRRDGDGQRKEKNFKIILKKWKN